MNPDTPWGKPSAPILILEHNGVPIAFLARHGAHHQYAPHEVPARANIAALRHLGVRCVIAFSAVGSLQEEIKPMDFVVPDQIIDRTKGIRPFTFFEGGLVGHVPFGDPFDPKIVGIVKGCAASMQGEGVTLHDKGTIICMGKSLLLLRWTGRRPADKRAPQRDRSSRPEPSPTCTGRGAAPSSTCRRCPRRSWPARPRWLTR